MKKVAAYCRVSTDRQKNEQTIEVQERFIEEWAKSNNVVIVEWYKDDGWSGDTLDRPDLDRLRDDVEKNLWQGVVFIDRDRLARTLGYQEYVIRELRDKEVEVIFLNNPLADTPLERSMQQVYGIVAEMERINTAERMRKGKIHKAKSGKIVGHNAPYGYRYQLKVGDKDGYYEIHEPEAQIVKTIFKWIGEDGYSLRQVLKALYEAKIKPPKGKRDVWVKSTLKRMVHSETYIGNTYYNKYKAVVPKNPKTNERYKKVKKSSRVFKSKEEWIAINVPKIIDKELFDKVQTKLTENSKFRKGQRKHNYMLTGLIKCTCGFNRVGDGVNGHYYYRCSSRVYKFPLKSDCIAENADADVLDEKVWLKLLEKLKDNSDIRQQAEEWIKGQQINLEGSNADLDSLQRIVNKLNDEEENVLTLYREKLITLDQVKKMLDEIRSKKKLLEQQRESMQVQSTLTDFSIENLDEVCQTVYHTIKYASPLERKDYARELISEVIIGERREARVKGKLSLSQSHRDIQNGSIYRDRGLTQRGKIHII